MRRPSDVLIPDPVHPGHSLEEVFNLVYFCLLASLQCLCLAKCKQDEQEHFEVFKRVKVEKLR